MCFWRVVHKQIFFLKILKAQDKSLKDLYVFKIITSLIYLPYELLYMVFSERGKFPPELTSKANNNEEVWVPFKLAQPQQERDTAVYF